MGLSRWGGMGAERWFVGEPDRSRRDHRHRSGVCGVGATADRTCLRRSSTGGVSSTGPSRPLAWAGGVADAGGVPLDALMELVLPCSCVGCGRPAPVLGDGCVAPGAPVAVPTPTGLPVFAAGRY